MIWKALNLESPADLLQLVCHFVEFKRALAHPVAALGQFL
jgi:hypothetical protein